MLSFIHVDFVVHELFEWLSRNKGDAFNIETFDLFCVLIISFCFHCANPFVPLLDVFHFFHFNSSPWYFILIFRNYFYVTFKFYVIVMLACTLTFCINMIL